MKERMVEKTEDFYATINGMKSKTFSDLYSTNIDTKAKSELQSIKSDSHLLHRLLNAARGGRKVDMESVLKHELSELPLSLVKRNGDINQPNKSDMIQLLTTKQGITISDSLEASHEPTVILIDGQAWVNVIGAKCFTKHQTKAGTFAEFAEYFHRKLLKLLALFPECSRIDLVFDRYFGTSSIK